MPCADFGTRERFAQGAGGHHGVRSDHHTTVEKGHGRQEERSVAVIYEPTGLPSDWPGVAAVVSVLRERVVKGTATTTVHFYLTSYAGTAQEIAELIRGHWEIENGLHWVLDVNWRIQRLVTGMWNSTDSSWGGGSKALERACRAMSCCR